MLFTEDDVSKPISFRKPLVDFNMDIQRYLTCTANQFILFLKSSPFNVHGVLTISSAPTSASLSRHALRIF